MSLSRDRILKDFFLFTLHSYIFRAINQNRREIIILPQVHLRKTLLRLLRTVNLPQNSTQAYWLKRYQR